MATTIREFFGFRAEDHSQAAIDHADRALCPFLGDKCTKTLSDGLIAGVCTLKPSRSGPVICCPVRLYADDYRILRDVADIAFTPGLPMKPGRSAVIEATHTGSDVIAVFGKRWGGELHLPQRGGVGAYFVDWILARINGKGDLVEFVAIEVQSIDTTGNYRDSRIALLDPARSVVPATAGFNWENVNKRILPQLIYKGNVLQREQLCRKGLFFVTPVPVYNKIVGRLGGAGVLQQYPLQSGSITFLAYDLDPTAAADPSAHGKPVPLVQQVNHTTSIVQVAQAFAAPGALPPMDVYQRAIRTALTP